MLYNKNQKRKKRKKNKLLTFKLLELIRYDIIYLKKWNLKITRTKWFFFLFSNFKYKQSETIEKNFHLFNCSIYTISVNGY